MESNIPFRGTMECVATLKSGKACTHKAYFIDGNVIGLCGTHSNKDTRRELPKNPNAEEDAKKIIDENMASCIQAGTLNNQARRPGHVICSKFQMMKSPGFVDGYRNVFPNFNHNNRKDGICLPSLSPMALGPVRHGQPGLPDALNLENFHQANKIFRSEVDANGCPTREFFTTQVSMYQDPVPHRHKNTTDKTPICSIWVTKDGKLNAIDYITSRQFYCVFYERLVRQQPDFGDLAKLVDQGYNLRIIGFDGHDTNGRSIEEWYLDPALPFGHEMVLYTMLTEPDSKKYPWNNHKTFDF
jgi:hypothetical protein